MKLSVEGTPEEIQELLKLLVVARSKGKCF